MIGQDLIDTLFCLVHKLLEAIEDPRFTSIRIPIGIFGSGYWTSSAFDKFAHFFHSRASGALLA
ncbi:hypothetical protein BS47DRAFT_1352320 [Hydnum rufescens UP504]|uniref:Uncharacterized protein n=1 Tax=Hydnum rufescens UP504 TaxID=1448309 RepID=A0A9P6AJN2_9AGAM|nr:hypothetical protein BS47DRAFT_1352320 [Hydnum rufescens UP504]